MRSLSAPRLRSAWRRGSWPALLAVAVALALGAAFLGLGSEIAEGETRALDLAVLRAMQTFRTASPQWADAMRDLSGMGSVVVLTLVTLVSVAYLALFTSVLRALLVALAVGLGATTVVVLKLLFGRARPDSDLAAYAASGLSFPSGHSTMSAVVFLTIGTLVASARKRRSEQAFIVLTSTLAALLVGISRVVLGVHYATDVLGGWAFGVAWAIAWLLLVRLVTRRGKRPRDGG